MHDEFEMLPRNIQSCINVQSVTQTRCTPDDTLKLFEDTTHVRTSMYPQNLHIILL